jgi:glutathione peroxidase
MKKSLFISIIIILVSCQKNAQNTPQPIEKNMEKQTIYQFKVDDISGNTFDFANLKGKKVMIVNTASECGLTPQYRDLELIYNEYKNQDFIIVGFPANNFGAQEPGTNSQIASFCQKNYGVSFPMMSKISVKGNDMHPLYRFLTQKEKNGVEDSEVQWNFQKFLINERGELEKVIAPSVIPTDDQIISWIKK